MATPIREPAPCVAPCCAGFVAALSIVVIGMIGECIAQEEEVSLAALRFQFDIESEKAGQPIVDLGAKYGTALTTLANDLQEAGELAGLLSVRGEIDRFEKKGTPAGDHAELAALANLQRIYAHQRERAGVESARRLHTAKLDFRQKLEIAVKRLTAENNEEGALQARTAIAELGILTRDLPSWGHGMVLHLMFNSERDGKVTDASRSGNHAQLKGDARLEPSGEKRGGFLSLDGAGDFAECVHDASLSLTTDATICLWLRPHELNHMRGLVCKYTPHASYTLRLTHHGGPGHRVNFGDGRFHNNNRAQLDLDVWVHLVVTLTGGRVKFYVDGKLDREGPSVGKGELVQNTDPLRIGSDYDGRYFKGDIDEVRIYRRALSASEIGEMFRTEL